MNAYEQARERFVKKGYKNARKEKQLQDELCYRNAIYYSNKTGALYTTMPDGTPYSMVRDDNEKLPKEMYICVHCKKAFKTYISADKHYQPEEEVDV